MSIPGRWAALVVLSLELLGTRAARADSGADVAQGGLAPRKKRVRLELSYVWPDPLPPAPPAGSAATSGTPAPSSSEPSPNASPAQIALAALITLVGEATGILVAVRAKSLAAGTIPIVAAPLVAGAVVCNVDASTPGRGGRCSATLVGALIGAAVGFLPGVLSIAGAGSGPKDESAYHDWVQSQYSGIVLSGILYAIAVPVGTIVGYNLGTPPPPTPIIVPPVATAPRAMPLFTLRF